MGLFYLRADLIFNQKAIKSYQQEIRELSPFCEIYELSSGNARIAYSPQLQGRVLTSCAQVEGVGYGWLNQSLIQSQKHQPHINAYGGEDRLWIGPEAGQFALFFQPGEAFNQTNWQTPACIDSETFELTHRSESTATLSKRASLKNYGNQPFDIEIQRRLKILSEDELFADLHNVAPSVVEAVAYESNNAIVNRSDKAWSKSTGLLNIWILGQFKSGPESWAILPTKEGARINQNYFEADLSERLIELHGMSLMLVDGEQKAKIGLAPSHDKNVLGSIDFSTNTLTIVRYETAKSDVFLNSEWNIQEKPYLGDVLNVYNDGPDENGTILGPYFELETSSSSKELEPNESINHLHSTLHFTGELGELNKISQQLLDADLNEIKSKINAG